MILVFVLFGMAAFWTYLSNEIEAAHANQPRQDRTVQVAPAPQPADEALDVPWEWLALGAGGIVVLGGAGAGAGAAVRSARRRREVSGGWG